MSRKPHILPLLILTLCCVIFFHKILMGGQTLYVRDLSTLEIPAWIWLKNHFGSLWNPLLFTGMPSTANPQFYAFDLFHLLTLPFPAVWGFQFFLVIHFLFAGIGFYILFQKWGFTLEVSLFSSLAFCFGGFFISLAQLPLLLNTLTFFPWVLFFYSNICHSNNLKCRIQNLLLTALFLGLAWFGGEPQMVLFILSSCVLLTLCIETKNIPSSLTYLVLAIFISILIASVQLIPFYEFLGHSNRSGALSPSQANAWSLQKDSLLNLLIPHHWSPSNRLTEWGYGFWEKQLPYLFSIHVGIVTLILAFFGMTTKNLKIKYLGLGLVVLGILLSLGNQSFFYRLCFKILPLFNHFRFPEKYFFFCHFGLCILAALGLRHLKNHPIKSFNLPRTKKILVISIIFILGILIGFLFMPSFLSQFPKKSFWVLYFPKQILFAWIFVHLFFSIYWFSPSPKMRTWLWIGLLFLELFRAHYYLNPTQSKKPFFEKPAVAKFILEKNPRARIFTLSPKRLKEQKLNRDESLPTHSLYQRQTLFPNTGLENEIADLKASNSLSLATRELVSPLFEKDPLKTLNLFGVNFLLSPDPIKQQPLKLRFQTTVQKKNFFVYEVPYSLPTLYGVYDWKFVEKASEIQNKLMDENFNPLTMAIIQGNPLKAYPKASSSPIKANFSSLSLQNDEARVHVQTAKPMLLVYLQSYYPGWKVFLNGHRMTLLRINQFFQGVFVPQGNHQVTFSYRSESFNTGALFSIFSLTTLLLILGFSFFKKD